MGKMNELSQAIDELRRCGERGARHRSGDDETTDAHAGLRETRDLRS